MRSRSVPAPSRSWRRAAARRWTRSAVSWTGSASAAWPGGLDDRVGLPKRLAADFAADVHAFLPLSALANRIRVDDLRTAVEGLGGDTAGLRKAELVDLLTALYADTALIARVIAALPTAARAHLELLATPDGLWDGSWDGGFGLRLTGPTAVLVHAGLLLPAGYGPPVVPREVVLARAGGDRLRGRPELAASADPPDDGRAGAEAAAPGADDTARRGAAPPARGTQEGRDRHPGAHPAVRQGRDRRAGPVDRRRRRGRLPGAHHDGVRSGRGVRRLARGDGGPPVGRGRAGLVHAGRRADEPGDRRRGGATAGADGVGRRSGTAQRCCGRRRAAARSQR